MTWAMIVGEGNIAMKRLGAIDAAAGYVYGGQRGSFRWPRLKV